MHHASPMALLNNGYSVEMVTYIPSIPINLCGGTFFFSLELKIVSVPNGAILFPPFRNLR